MATHFKSKNDFVHLCCTFAKPQKKNKLTKNGEGTTEHNLVYSTMLPEKQVACSLWQTPSPPFGKHIPSNMISSYPRRKEELELLRAPESFVFILWPVVLTASPK